jgi:hypothetical protein
LSRCGHELLAVRIGQLRNIGSEELDELRVDVTGKDLAVGIKKGGLN